MKKRLLSPLLFLCSGGLLLAQTNKTISPAEYEHLKLQHQLEKGVHYSLTPVKHLTTASVQKLHPPVNAVDSAGSGSCSCMVPLDSSFSVVPMDSLYGGTPPEFRNDDGSSYIIHLPFTFQIFGQNYDSLYINNNGNVSFDIPYSAFTAYNFPDSNFKMVAPFWADVDTRNSASGLVYYKMTPHYMVVRWDHVGYFSQHTDKINDFQLIISDGTDSILPNGNNVAFCYGDMQWTTGDASSGFNGFGGVASTVGVNNGDGINFSQITRNDSTGIQYDGPNGLSDGVDWLDNQSFYFNTSGLNGVEPIAYDSLCDSLVPVFDSLGNPFRVFLNAMNANDSITFVVQSLPSGMTINPHPQGNATELDILYVPTALGTQTLDIAYSNARYPSQIHHYLRTFGVQSVSNATGIKSLSALNTIALYPNPAKNTVSLRFGNNELYTVKILDVLGKVTATYTNVSSQAATIDVSNLNKGIYTVIIENALKQQTVKKLIIE